MIKYLDKNGEEIKDGMTLKYVGDVVSEYGTLETVKQYDDDLYILGKKSDMWSLSQFTTRDFVIVK